MRKTLLILALLVASAAPAMAKDWSQMLTPKERFDEVARNLSPACRTALATSPQRGVWAAMARAGIMAVTKDFAISQAKSRCASAHASR